MDKIIELARSIIYSPTIETLLVKHKEGTIDDAEFKRRALDAVRSKQKILRMIEQAIEAA